ncbi:hypothetical protein MUK42_29434 [Musa troglodytarum]|uniref:Uncharacterized protein n=1 Tax=Musa troglodytarum TaxID=320322 RepID=A0A9E7K2Z8_9LILI|nr:hypothetical protein MUK42_29434 [Musa troglodytarum]
MGKGQQPRTGTGCTHAMATSRPHHNDDNGSHAQSTIAPTATMQATAQTRLGERGIRAGSGAIGVEEVTQTLRRIVHKEALLFLFLFLFWIVEQALK